MMSIHRRDPHSWRARAAIAFAAVLVVIPFATSGAVAHGPDPAFSGTFAANQELRFRWRAGSEPTAVIKAAIRDAAVEANDSRGSKAAIFIFDSGWTEPDRLRPGGDLRRQRAGLLHAG